MDIKLYIQTECKQCRTCGDLKENFFYYWCECGWTETVVCINCVEDPKYTRGELSTWVSVENCALCEEWMQRVNLRDVLKKIRK